MKKAVSLIFTMLMLCSFAVAVNAEEFNGADLFTVDLPEEFYQTGSADGEISFRNEKGDTFIVVYSDNTEEDNVISLRDLSKKDIEEYASSLSEEAESLMKEYADEFKLEFLTCEKAEHASGKTTLVSQIKTTLTQDGETDVFYQKMYEFRGVKYKYTFTYTTDEEDKKDSFNEVFDSINIFEAETQSNLDKLSGYAVAGAIALLIIIGIIRFIRTPEKREKGKL